MSINIKRISHCFTAACTLALTITSSSLSQNSDESNINSDFSAFFNYTAKKQIPFFETIPLDLYSDSFKKWNNVTSAGDKNIFVNDVENEASLLFGSLLNRPFPEYIVDYEIITRTIAENYDPSKTVKCSETSISSVDIQCSNREIAQSLLQINKSIQSLAKALELSGSAVESRFMEDIIRKDMGNYGIYLSLIEPSIKLARIYATDKTFFGERGSSIYELSNLALGYLYAPNLEFPSLSNYGLNTKSKIGRIDADCNLVFDIFDKYNEPILLLDYTHPVILNSESEYYIMDHDYNRVNIFGDKYYSYLYNNPQQEYFLGNSTSPYDISEMQIPDLYGQHVSDFHAGLLIEDISMGRIWKINDYDALQQHFSGANQFDHYASGSRLDSSITCNYNCNNRLDFRKQVSSALNEFGVSMFDLGVGLLDGVDPQTVLQSYMAVNAGFNHYNTVKRVDSFCQVGCGSVSHLQEDIRYNEQISNKLESEKIALEQNIRSLELKQKRLEAEREREGQNIVKLNDDFDKKKKNLEEIDYATDKKIEERRKLEKEKDDIREKEQEAIKKEQEIIDKQKEASKREAEQKAELEKKNEEIAEIEREIKKANDELEEKKKEIEKPKQTVMECDDPAFVLPKDHICVRDPISGKPKVVVDQSALDKRGYLATCARITVPPGTICTVVDGRPILVSLPKSGFTQPEEPKLDQCKFMYLTPGSVCRMVGGRPTITNSFDIIRSNRIPELSTTFCNYAQVEDGYECIDSADGPIIQPIKSQHAEYALKLLNRQSRNRCNVNQNYTTAYDEIHQLRNSIFGVGR